MFFWTMYGLWLNIFFRAPYMKKDTDKAKDRD